MRSYQPNIDKPTEELKTQVLKDLTQSEPVNMAIDAYRNGKRRMAEAEANQKLDEFIWEVLQTDDYQSWLADNLKKDERRRKKKVPADDLKRVN